MPIFKTASSNLHYHEYGNGKEILLAFHGFGMRGTQFKVLEEAFGQKYRIISFDLFFHGETRLNDNSVGHIRKGLDAREFAAHINQFLDAEFPGTEKVALLSYSIGTRMALCLIENLPHRIAATYLIAPDGIEPNRLLKLGGANFVVNRIFYKLVYSPKTVTFCLNLLLKLNYIDEAIHRILKAEFGTTETRLTCYNTITYYAQLKFNRKRIAEAINTHKIDCHFYFGKKDKLFPSKIGERFSTLLADPNIHVFDGGHELVNAEMNNYLATQLKQHHD
ncbi:alpha/beta hydrolase [Pedobacter sp. KR3-3]|uniref:Alpha/beta hydrolase n=1 Tax=Pedobacter albus TaxID=3113905 RepID=A0ABU7I8W3_9SPHI|nr:alpha/beta hydrolase [Pedobacter sp. KR3-3]MEE1945654.1 alpha/beta hydrolase [Pedobacter sp. KR3-3]